MGKYGLKCPIRKANPYRRMAKALRTSNVAGNLLKREFRKYGPRTVLLTNITYLPYNGAFAYLPVILDAFTKQALAYATSPSLEVGFVLETVGILISSHGAGLKTKTLLHSGQGCHYTSYSYIDILKACGSPCQEKETAGTMPHRKASSAIWKTKSTFHSARHLMK